LLLIFNEVQDEISWHPFCGPRCLQN